MEGEGSQFGQSRRPGREARTAAAKCIAERGSRSMPIHGRSRNAILRVLDIAPVLKACAPIPANRPAQGLPPLPDLSHITVSFSGDCMPSKPAGARPGVADPSHELSGTELGLRLRTARRTKGWTMKQLAE